MQFSPQQNEAIGAVAKWLRMPARVAQVFYLAGYAGTGKTTIARHLAGGYDGKTQFCAFTGKAALVMERAGCVGARTIHSLIYNSQQKSTKRMKELETELASSIVTHDRSPTPATRERVTKLRKLVAEEADRLKQPAFNLNPESPLHNVGLIVADECSMIDDKMAVHLKSFGKKILVLGDPAQLPPVTGAGYFTKDKPDFTLTEIHRQATDNPIIALATLVRNGKKLNLGTYGESRIIARKGSTAEDWSDSDQILVGMNATRRRVNLGHRARRGIETCLPIVGDKLICLRNDSDLGLLNGSLWRATAVTEMNEDRLLLGVESLDNPNVRLDVESHTATFQGRVMDWHEKLDAQDFDHAIAITVHKAQGSQWGSVTLVDEWTRSDYAKWLYTAITRAADRITIIR